jgi:DNA-3-methyladenine glycosylase I
MIKRCAWVPDEELYIRYHDQEWGVPQYDDRMLFELLILEGAQAGLSWSTILRKRENYRQAFDNFDAIKIARYDHNRIQKLLNNPGIVRNKLKIESTIKNAEAFLKIQEKHGSFSKYIWSFVNGKPIIHQFQRIKELPARTEISDKMSKVLKKDGFNFVGSTICYAFMQAVGMVNDHTVDCFRYQQVLAKHKESFP